MKLADNLIGLSFCILADFLTSYSINHLVIDIWYFVLKFVDFQLISPHTLPFSLMLLMLHLESVDKSEVIYFPNVF